tara:strand:- start:769 stop:1299 length:531 start_codon:yes stop_codon:yes gene_type:complete
MADEKAIEKGLADLTLATEKPWLPNTPQKEDFEITPVKEQVRAEAKEQQRRVEFHQAHALQQGPPDPRSLGAQWERHYMGSTTPNKMEQNRNKKKADKSREDYRRRSKKKSDLRQQIGHSPQTTKLIEGLNDLTKAFQDKQAQEAAKKAAAIQKAKLRKSTVDQRRKLLEQWPGFI